MRCTGVDYTETRAPDAAEQAAELVADILGWDAAHASEEATAYRAMVERLYGVPG